MNLSLSFCTKTSQFFVSQHLFRSNSLYTFCILIPIFKLSFLTHDLDQLRHLQKVTTFSAPVQTQVQIHPFSSSTPHSILSSYPSCLFVSFSFLSFSSRSASFLSFQIPTFSSSSNLISSASISANPLRNDFPQNSSSLGRRLSRFCSEQ